MTDAKRSRPLDVIAYVDWVESLECRAGLDLFHRPALLAFAGCARVTRSEKKPARVPAPLCSPQKAPAAPTPRRAPTKVPGKR